MAWEVRWILGTCAAILLSVSISTVATAQTQRVPGTLVVQFRGGFAPKYEKGLSGRKVMAIASVDQLNEQYGLETYRRLFPAARTPKAPLAAPDLTGYHILHFPIDSDLDQIAAAYRADPNVVSVEFDQYAFADAIPNDSLFDMMWDLRQTSDIDVNADLAWDIAVGSPSVILGVTDTGVQYDHPDLRDNIWVNPGEDLDHDGVVYDADDMNGIDDDGNGYVDDVIGWDFVADGTEPGDYPVTPGEDAHVPDNDPRDFYGHGTHTSGTVAAATNNEIGVSGLAGGFGPGRPGCKIMCLRMGWSIDVGGVEFGITKMSYVSEAFVYATDMGVRAINYSFGSGSEGGIVAATDYAVAHGVTICASAGNNGSTSNFGYLQSRSDVITVAATDDEDHRALFSNYGSLIDISAPGVYIWSTFSDHYTPTYARFNGTSMAAPHVVGLVGLILSINPGLTRQQVRDIITQTAVPINEYVGQMGAGRIDGHEAVLAAGAFALSHNPLVNTSNTSVPYTVGATIFPDTALRTDSLSLFYRTSNGSDTSFTRVPLQATSDPNEYAADIPAQPIHSTIEYGLTIEDESGRRLTAPTDFPLSVISFQTLGSPLLVSYPDSFGVQIESGDEQAELLTIRNDGTDSLNFSLNVRDLSLPSQTMVLSDLEIESQDLLPSDSALSLTVTPDAGLIGAGDSLLVNFHFDASSFHQDTTLEFVVTLTADDSVSSMIDIPAVMQVLAPDHYVALSPPSATETVIAGDTVWYVVTLTNSGAIQDSYHLIDSNAHWPIDIWDSSGQSQIVQTPILSQNDRYLIKPRVIVPETTVFGETDSLYLIVESVGEPTNRAIFVALTYSVGISDSIPWGDDFSNATLDSTRWRMNFGATVDDRGLTEPSPPYSLNLNGDPYGGDSIESGPIDLRGRDHVILSYWYQRTGGGENVDTGDDLIFEILDEDEHWIEVSRQIGAAPDMSTFELVETTLPAAALHDACRLRIRSLASVGPLDDWFVDDVLIYALLPPSICHTPDSLHLSLPEKSLIWDTLAICNNGPGVLRYEVVRGANATPDSRAALLGPPNTHDAANGSAIDDQGSAPTVAEYSPVSYLQLNGHVRIVAWTAYADVSREYPNTLDALSKYFTDFTLSETGTTDPEEMTAALSGQDILLIPEQEWALDLSSVGTQMSAVLSDFLGGGGGIVACFDEAAEFLDAAGVIDVAIGPPVTVLPVQSIADHPVTETLNDTYASQNATHALESTDATPLVATVSGNRPIVIVKDEDGGGIVVLGSDFYNYTDFMARVLGNAVQWLSSGRQLSISPVSDTVAPGGTSYVAIEVNSDNAGAGDYNAHLVIESNDFDVPEFDVPITWRITGPDIRVYPDTVVDTVVEDSTSAVSYWVRNVGEDVLHIGSIGSDRPWLQPADLRSGTMGEPMPAGLGRPFPVRPAKDRTGTIIAPGDLHLFNLTINAADLIAGNYSGHVIVHSDDFDEQASYLPVSVHVGPEPDIAISPDALTIALPAGSFKREQLIISNMGAGVLSYNSFVRFFPVTTAQKTVDQDEYPDWYFDAIEKHTEDTRMGQIVSNSFGGPDAGGYRWIDSDQSGGPEFEWIDISSTGILVDPLSDDNALGPYPIGFEFPFYDSIYTDFWISSNGFIGFGPTTDYWFFTNSPLPAPSTPNNIICWNWDDLYFNRSNPNVSEVHVRNDSDRVIIQFNRVPRCCTQFGPWITAEIILTPDGTILIQYLKVHSDFATTPTIGLENIDGTQGLEVAFNPPAPYAHDSLALRFRPFVDWLSISPTTGVLSPTVGRLHDVNITAIGLTETDYHGEIVTTSNDPDDDSIVTAVDLHVLRPEIAVDRDTLDVSVNAGTLDNTSLAVSNDGDGTLHIAMSAQPSWLHASPGGLLISPGVTRNVSVTASPAPDLIPGEYNGFVRIETNVLTRPEIVLPVVLHVGPEPNIEIVPDRLSVALPLGDTTSRLLTVQNTGQGLLFVRTIVPEFTDATVVAISPVFTFDVSDEDKSSGPDLDYVYHMPMGNPDDSVAPMTPTLETARNNLESGYSTITAAIPERFDFIDGESGFFIRDGLADMYDRGNILGTDRGDSLPYSNDSIATSSLFGPGGRYFTRKYPGLFVLAAKMQGVEHFTINGDLGADGGGSVDGVILQATVAGRTFRGYVKRVYGAFDPSVNHMIIVEGAANQEFSTNTNSDYHRVDGLSSTNRLYYLLYAGRLGYHIDDASTLGIMEAFLQTLGLSPEWLSASSDSLLIAPQSSATITVGFDATGVVNSENLAVVVLSSNDPDEPLLDVPIQLSIGTTAGEITSAFLSPDFDVDGDGKVDVADVLAALRTLFGTGEQPGHRPSNSTAMPSVVPDWNADGRHDLADAILLIDRLWNRSRVNDSG